MTRNYDAEIRQLEDLVRRTRRTLKRAELRLIMTTEQAKEAGWEPPEVDG